MTVSVDAMTIKLIAHGGVLLICSLIVLAFCFVDLWDGVRTAHAVGDKIRSHKLRKTLGKFLYYWAFILCGNLIDLLGVGFTWWAMPYITMLLTAVVGVIEMHSLIEHAHRRKDAASKIDDVLRQIISASTSAEAKELLPRITAIINATENKE